MIKRIEFDTSDGVHIVGDRYETTKPMIGQLLLLHMMPADRTSWYAFAEKAAALGLTSLAIDLRGHGESISHHGSQLAYQTFTHAQHQQSILDIEAALKKLDQAKPIITVGASIGANLSLEALVRWPSLPAAVLLSPGLDYKGIKTNDLIGKLAPSQQLFLVASNDDDYSFETIRILNNLRDEQTIIRQLSGAGHGTTMLERQPELTDDILEWIQGITR